MSERPCGPHTIDIMKRTSFLDVLRNSIFTKKNLKNPHLSDTHLSDNQPYSVLCRLQVLPEVQHGFELTVSRNFDTPLSQDQSMNPNRLSLAENELSKLSVFFEIWQASFRATAHKRLKITENATICSFCCRVQNIRSPPLSDHSL